MKHRLQLPWAAVDLVVAVALAQGQTNRIQAVHPRNRACYEWP